MAYDIRGLFLAIVQKRTKGVCYMHMRSRRIFALCIIVAAAIASVLAYPHLPALIASHWDVNGRPNGVLPRLWGVALVPLIMTGFVLLFALLIRIDPRIKQQKDHGPLEWLVIDLLLFLAYVHALTLAYNLGWHADTTYWIMPGIAALYIAFGMILGRLPPSWFFGIRTPWTLEDETVWKETHRLGGKLFAAGGIFILFGLLAPLALIWFVLIGTFLPAIIAVVYSYFLYTKRHPKHT